MRLAYISIAALALTTCAHAREWTDSSGVFSVEGKLIWHDEKSVVIEKTGGDRVYLEIDQLSPKDRLFLNQPQGKPAPKVTQTPRRRRNAKARLDSEYTAWGEIKLTQEEIDLFVQQCKQQKPKILEELKRELNSNAENAPPGAIVELQQMFDFLSQDNVLIAPRLRVESYSAGREKGAIFKPCGGSYSPKHPNAKAESLEVLDGSSALVKLEGHGPAVLKGIDTRHLPNGTWQSFFLLKSVDSQTIPGAVGPREVQVVQAVSNEGFPKDIVIW